jgi:mannose-6-phosphate isomerase-like protein (cupin superfamily)
MPEKRYIVARYEKIPPVDCPCGQSRRAFVGTGSPASMHVVEIKKDSRAHWHKKLTEIYYVLEGRGRLEADGDRVALAPGTAVLIRPGCRHRAVGRLKVLVVAMPPFDPADEFEDAAREQPRRRNG